MNKNAIKKFAIEARTKLIASVTDKAGMLGITEKSCSEPITKGADFEVYQTVAGTEVTLNKRQCEQRRRLVSQIESRGFEAVVEEVAYTWFNRICAIRFMEVNDYLPNRVRVLSSEKEGKMEPDLVTQAPDVDLDLTAQEKEEIINWKLSGTSEDTDKLYCKLFLKQCHQLHDILPGLFEADSDYMELLFGISYTNKDDVIYMLVNPETGIPENDFNVSALDEEGNPTGQVEIIGWLYQYYNTELKDDTFAKLKKNVKITKERIPAATQLFTPDWIVRYMVENSVGRIWIEHLRAVDPMTDEKATAERFGWKYYLPEAEQEEEVNVKLAEIRTTYKDLKPTDITCIDPCMGSGHILIAMFDVLMDIYESAGYDKREAAFEIVEHNIHGLDIDQRAYQLAYFAVMMKGRGYNRRFLRGRDGKPEPKVYAITESNEINRNHLKFFGTHLSDMERNLAVMQIEGLLDTFIDAREYGSILNVDACDWDVLERFVEDLGTAGQISFESVGCEETQEGLRKLARVAKNLGQKYDAVVTNPPYMSSGGMNKELTQYIRKEYVDEKADMFAVVMKRGMSLSKKFGYISMITMESWMFLPTFETFRKLILEKESLISLVHMPYLGKGGTSLGIAFGTAAFLFLNYNVNRISTDYECIRYYETDDEGIPFAFPTINERRITRKQNDFAAICSMPIAYWARDEVFSIFKNNKTLLSYIDARSGISTGDNNRFYRCWFECKKKDIAFDCKNTPENSEYKWFPIIRGGEYRKWYGNMENVLNLRNDGFEIRTSGNNYRLRTPEFYNKLGITWNRISSRDVSFRIKTEQVNFGENSPCMFVNKDCIYDLMGFLNSKVAKALLEYINSTMTYQVIDIQSIPYINEHDDRIEKLVKECIEIEKIDWDSFEKSWDFIEHPFIKHGKSIEYGFNNWKIECKQRFDKIKQNEEKINEILIEKYNLQKCINATVEDEDITIRLADEKKDLKSFISFGIGCILGRYAVKENAKDKSYVSAVNNILPFTEEEYFEEDVVKEFQRWLVSIYGLEKLEENMEYIARILGGKGSSVEILRNYFINDFFKDHCSSYTVTSVGKRPIYWLFDSGKENGFKALIYMHRYDADTVGRVRTDYLHRAQKYVETAMQSAQYTIDNASSASEKSKATKAVTKYTKQLAEMKIYDEAIAHIANKRVEIDLDDGVKVNYEKFQGVEVAQEGKKTLKVDLLAKIK